MIIQMKQAGWHMELPDLKQLETTLRVYSASNPTARSVNETLDETF